MSFAVRANKRPFPLHLRMCLTSLEDTLATIVAMETAAHKGLLFYGYQFLYHHFETTTATGRDTKLLDGERWFRLPGLHEDMQTGGFQPADSTGCLRTDTLYLEPLDSLLASRCRHDALLDAGD